MTSDFARPTHANVEAITDTMAAFVQETGRLVRLQDDVLEAARGMLSEQHAHAVNKAIMEATELNIREFNTMIGALATAGYGVGVRDRHDYLLPVEKLTFDTVVKKYSLECAWQNETHAVVFDDTTSFTVLETQARQAARPVA